MDYNNTLMRHQLEDLYHEAAKQLYNTALFAVGEEALAEQAAAGAFSDAFALLSDKSDIVLFEKHCYRLLYRYGKRLRQSNNYKSRTLAAFSEKLPRIPQQKHLGEMLTGLDYRERYIVLLFCLRKYSVRQIAGITRLPCFMIERHLVSAVGKAMH